MATKKQHAKQEPLLNTVARSLGRAAGALTRATQEWTGNISDLPQTLTDKVRDAASVAVPVKRSRRTPRKTIRRVTRKQATNRTTGAGKRRSSKKQSLRS